ncbi:MAG: hypothetical protein F6J97_22950 [Leptolyngbya sp. SIO4C1]|nr:hypothetical protein [Leptolyngbya sp. SIO4C1]
MISTPRPAPPPRVSLKPLIAGGLMFALVGLVFDMQGIQSFLGRPSSAQTGFGSDRCDAIMQAEAKLSREQLARLLTIPERDAKSRVRQVVSEPYCTLPTLNVRSGVTAEREAYPLAFDPATTLVILYENDEYAGYRFSFR